MMYKNVLFTFKPKQPVTSFWKQPALNEPTYL